MKPSDLKAALKAKRPVFGFMVSATASMRWGRVFAGSTLDFVVIDSEHGSRDRQLIADTVAQMQSLDITAIVRTPNTEEVYVAMALDAGADGVLVPYCETVDEVRHCAVKLRTHPLKGEYYERVVETGEYPSEKSKKYLAERHKNHIFIMGIESEPAANRVGELIDCADIDGVFIGPNDMSTSLGIPDESGNPIYLDTLSKIIAEADKRGIPTMIHQQTIDTSAKAIELGARFIMHSSDAGILLRGTQEEFAELRKITSKKYGVVDEVEAEDTLDVV
ncbi:MAG: aldolase/citrate lyase family protein [Dehalococcoidia bacterium]|jgi:4-hydroxy-2-oxoheptanedioate aldolase|uniref:HpcH/HpaI aldolase/citrate lyase domain-containing protein n=1 Tax=marine metagenome TaxID=408172 RepID=A0A381S022_9ZZZZ|nr:aldolase/citrate lyase family protein [Dehalococcoidia bacterium]MDP7089342.1 aldolase/citrate lyase family protein [Dehalococcoidia bacterium]|tara:strand:+ start:737 stop:1567 length:831 start_codon:yes stop_codon:yes gene_type:complete